MYSDRMEIGMIIFKCKICGGDLEITSDMTVGTCQYCASVMTLPKDTDEKKVSLFNRANHYRTQKEFDRAIGIYETILFDYSDDAEAYWGIVLCRYGIEYVEDPNTNIWFPTCHRTQFDSILNDADYKAAIENADNIAKQLYLAEAQKIDNIQKKILLISNNEKKFDVFICYKEKEDGTGSRTPDSVRAQDLYDKLIGVGFRVFFARITLEDKLGTNYEPYIFAALNSAKIMIVIGSRPDYLQTAWVKNEWSRFLTIAKKDPNRVLIPAYFNMDPYDMPLEFVQHQAQDMSKMGFEQDLIRAIRKTLDATISIAAPEISGTITADSLLDRAFLLLNDSQFNDAITYFDKVLDRKPREGRAYWGKMLSKLQCIDNVDMQSNHIINCLFDKYFSQFPILNITSQDISEKLLTIVNPDYKNAVEFAPANIKQEYLDSFNLLKNEMEKNIEQKKIAYRRREEEDIQRREEAEKESEWMRRAEEVEKQKEEQRKKREKLLQAKGWIFIIVLLLSFSYIMFGTNICRQYADSTTFLQFILLFLPYSIFCFVLAVICVVFRIKVGLEIMKITGVFYIIVASIWMSRGVNFGTGFVLWTFGIIIDVIGCFILALPAFIILSIGKSTKVNDAMQ